MPFWTTRTWIQRMGVDVQNKKTTKSPPPSRNDPRTSRSSKFNYCVCFGFQTTWKGLKRLSYSTFHSSMGLVARSSYSQWNTWLREFSLTQLDYSTQAAAATTVYVDPMSAATSQWTGSNHADVSCQDFVIYQPSTESRSIWRYIDFTICARIICPYNRHSYTLLIDYILG